MLFNFFVELMNHVLPASRSSDDRTIPLSVIADRTRLTIEDVEYLLMKSLSVSMQKFDIFFIHLLLKSEIFEFGITNFWVYDSILNMSYIV